MMATPIKMKPRNARVGPTTMRRTEKMPGSKAEVVELEPAIRRNPIMITAPAMAMRMKFVLTRGISLRLWGSSTVRGFAPEFDLD